MVSLDESLEFANNQLRRALVTYEFLEPGLSFGAFKPFVLTPEKPNTARTLVPVSYNCRSAGDMFAILFRPGDGTGDESIFKVWQLNIPQKYRQHPEKVLPRAKIGIEFELFLPFFSLGKKVSWYAASLEELTVDNVEHPNTVIKERDLGLKAEQYEKTLSAGDPVKPRIELTTGYRPDMRFDQGYGERRFGDPHAVYFGVDADAVQVVGFLPIKDNENPLINLAVKLAASYGRKR